MIRVERVVTDHGYGYGWVVLDRSGLQVSHHRTWQRAYQVADWYARQVGVA